MEKNAEYKTMFYKYHTVLIGFVSLFNVLLLSQQKENLSFPKDNELSLAFTNKNIDQTPLFLFVESRSNEGRITVRWLDVDDPKTRYKVYRSVKVIQKQEDIVFAEQVADLPYGIMEYSYYSLQEKPYYHAVVVHKQGEAISSFIEGQSYSTKTSLVLHKDIIRTGKIRLVITEYHPQKKNVTLGWIGHSNSSLTYQLYSHHTLLNTPDLLNDATLVTNITQPIGQIDLSIVTNERHYYAIVAISNEKIVIDAFGEESYSKNLIGIPFYIRDLQVRFDPSYRHIDLFWNKTEYLEKEPYDVFVFRSSNIIDTKKKTDISSVRGSVFSTKQSFKDTIIDIGTPYYYLILPRMKDTSWYDYFYIPNQNYTIQPIIKYPITRNLQLTHISHERQKNIRLTWKVEPYMHMQIKSDPNTTVYLFIYRLSQPFDNSKGLLSSIKNINTPHTSLVSHAPVGNYKTNQSYAFVAPQLSKKYHYAILLGQKNNLNETNTFTVPLIDEDNIIAETKKNKTNKNIRSPNKVKQYRDPTGRFTSFYDELRWIVKHYFYRQKYKKAAYALEDLFKRSPNRSRVEMKYLYLYLGRSFLEINHRKKALNYFKKLVTLDRTLGFFWIEKIK